MKIAAYVVLAIVIISLGYVATFKDTSGHMAQRYMLITNMYPEYEEQCENDVVLGCDLHRATRLYFGCKQWVFGYDFCEGVMYQLTHDLMLRQLNELQMEAIRNKGY